jgi:hypothetical protein
VAFVIDAQRLDWKAGELWYGDFSKVHSVKNDSAIARVHMVIDVQINDFVLSMFPVDFVERRRAEGISMCRAPLSASAAELRQYVCDFDVPGELMPIFTIGRSLFDLSRGARASVRLIDGELIALLDGIPAFRLDKIARDDAFAVAGLPPGITVRFRLDAGVREVVVNLKGLPQDLYFARLGKARGDVVADRTIALPVS